MIDAPPRAIRDRGRDMRDPSSAHLVNHDRG